MMIKSKKINRARTRFSTAERMSKSYLIFKKGDNKYTVRTHSRDKMLTLMAALGFSDPVKLLKYGVEFAGYYIETNEFHLPNVKRVISAIESKPRKLIPIEEYKKKLAPSLEESN